VAKKKKIKTTETTKNVEASSKSMKNPTQRPYDINNQGMGQVKTTVQIGGSANYGNKLANNPMRKTAETTKNNEDKVMASKAQYLKKRKVMRLSDVLDRKFDPGKGDPKTVNPNKKKSVVPRKPDYFSEAVQGLAYKLGLTNQPSAQAVREEAYKTKPEPKLLGSAKLDKPKGKKVYTEKPGPNRPLSKPQGQPYGVTGTEKRPSYGGGGARDSGGKSGSAGMGKYTIPKSIGADTTTATPTSTAGTGTGTGAEMKLSAFEKMKARMYERDVGPSTMSKKRIKERIQKERQYKSSLSNLFKRKGN
jgi:hypothetical protein